MRILVDADACPVKEIIIEEAKKNNICVIIYIDSSHVYESDYARVVICDTAKDSVDYKIIEESKVNDLIITNDYGLSALGLSKKCNILTFNGLIIDNNNIESLLNIRYLGVKSRKENKHISGPPKRNEDMNINFKKNLIFLINTYNKEK